MALKKAKDLILSGCYWQSIIPKESEKIKSNIKKDIYSQEIQEHQKPKLPNLKHFSSITEEQINDSHHKTQKLIQLMKKQKMGRNWEKFVGHS